MVASPEMPVPTAILECAINVSEGTDRALIDALAASCSDSLLDLHCDRHHNRSVFTLAGATVERDARLLATAAAEHIVIAKHSGVHPRFGSIDVVPFVPLPDTGATLAMAVQARDAFADWMGDALAIPCFLYGPQRTLPDVRRQAFGPLAPDTGPPGPHRRNGACAVGARGYLIAYNLWLQDTSFQAARVMAKALRTSSLRTLALPVGDGVQISCNLVDPLGPGATGPAEVYERVAKLADIQRAELVGLVPEAVLTKIDPARWAELDLSQDQTIEARLGSRADNG